MNILHITNRDGGGAGKACVRLHQGLLESGIDSNLLMIEQDDKTINKSFKFIAPFPKKIERYKIKIVRILKELHLYTEKDKYRKSEFLSHRPKKFGLFSFPNTPYDITQHPLYVRADIINLHWTTRFLDYNTFFRNNSKKIVWTLHDMNPFTGGCHYAGNCGGFKQVCEKCPQLINTIDDRYSNKNFQVKNDALRDIVYMTIVAPSKWLLEESKASSLFNKYPHAYIPYGLQQNLFKPLSKEYSRDMLGIPKDKKIILFVAVSLDDHRKGLEYLQDALVQFGEESDIILCVVGNKNDKPFRYKNLIHIKNINDERLMRVVYSAADVFALPSLEDNLPNTALESLLCGTPVIGFPIGGMPDIIDDNSIGILCDSVSVESLYAAVKYYFDNSGKYKQDIIRAIALAKYSLEIQAKAYISLYEKILKD